MPNLNYSCKVHQYHFIFPFLLFVCSNCKKNADHSGGGGTSDSTVNNSYTLTPSSSPVTTGITAYFQEPPIDPNYENSPYGIGASITAYPPNVINGLILNFSNGYYVLNTFSLDGFNTRFSGKAR